MSRSVRFGGERREEGRFSGTVIASRCYLGLDRGTITRASAWLLIMRGIIAWRTGPACDAALYCEVLLYVVFAILTKWCSLTRLETRTKESNIYASIWGENPDAQGKQNVSRHEVGTRKGALSTERSLAKDLSKSISVGTRKMVNYG